MKIGQELKSLNKKIDEKMVIAYANISGDHNPIHLDSNYAKDTIFEHTIAHGMLLISSISEMMLLNFNYEWPISGKLKIKFRNPLLVGQSMNCKGKITKIETENDRTLVTSEVLCTNEEEKILISGIATINIKE
jgi:acyl dehydratase|tara:strand:+ start:837 stop:1238 length:402 start_codon:yes stop_codon:yes gene_type:complete